MPTDAHRIVVGNYHLDGYGHVNNARYLEFLEAARWAWFAQHGLTAAARQTRLVVLHINIRYRRAAVLDDVLTVHSRLCEVKSRLLRLTQTVRRGSDTVAEAEVAIAPTDAAGNVVRLPDALRGVLAELLAAGDSEV
nr:acyl-CoA thioesterase [Conchiformibius kuhniae]